LNRFVSQGEELATECRPSESVLRIFVEKVPQYGFDPRESFPWHPLAEAVPLGSTVETAGKEDAPSGGGAEAQFIGR
jgi:hypothetical protein